jgi:hypothetical protein
MQSAANKRHTCAQSSNHSIIRHIHKHNYHVQLNIADENVACRRHDRHAAWVDQRASRSPQRVNPRALRGREHNTTMVVYHK